MKTLALALILAIGLTCTACSPPSPKVAEQPKQAPQTLPATLEALVAAHDWQHEDGKAANDAFDAGAKRILKPMTRSDAMDAIKTAGYECIYGEASEDYPDPAAVCTRSFATRSCQMDWEITSTAEKGKVDDVDGAFTRDCVGVADDWPEPKKSAIDDGLAPPPPLETKGN